MNPVNPITTDFESWKAAAEFLIQAANAPLLLSDFDWQYYFGAAWKWLGNI